MKAFWRYVMAGIGFAMLVTIVLLATGWGSAVAANVSRVLITNTARKPVPVTPTGTVPVHEQGTANVNLTGSPKVGLDPTLGNTVKIDSAANTVKIDAAGSGPIQTRAADNPAFSPVVRNLYLNWPGGSFGSGGTIYPVPSGHELVIEQFSVGATLNSGQQLAFGELNVNAATPDFAQFQLTGITSVDQGVDVVGSGAIQTRIYADPGTSVGCTVQRGGGTTGAASAQCDISGYLVPTP